VTAGRARPIAETVPLDVDGRALKGEFCGSATSSNTMIKQLSVVHFRSQSLAREVGTTASGRPGAGAR